MSAKDDFASVPVLEPDGSNWVVWKTRLQFAMAAKGTLGHLMGTATAPPIPGPVATSSAAPDPTTGTAKAPTTAEIAAHEAAVATHTKWQETEYLARWQLTRAIKDVTLQRVITKSAVSEMWKAIQADFESKSSLVQADLDELQSLQAELAAVGITISDEEQVSIIMKSLPRAYGHHLSSIAASAHLTGTKLTPSAVVSYVLEEYKRRKAYGDPKAEKGGKEAKEGKDVALSEKGILRAMLQLPRDRSPRPRLPQPQDRQREGLRRAAV